MEGKVVKIGDKLVGFGHPCFIIAEVGINHNGSVEIAKDLIKVAAQSGADAVKFQKRTVSRILTKEGLNKPYNSNHSFGKTYGEHKEFLELGEKEYAELFEYAEECGIMMTASAWDEEAVDFLEKFDVPFHKVASADLTNLPLLQYIAKTGKPMVISTGMADLIEVYTAMQTVLPFNKNIILLQCTSSYPSPNDQIHLSVIKTYQQLFPEAVIGFSGHEKGRSISIASTVLGAKLIERHLTLDRTMKGGDHAASLEPDSFHKLVKDIRYVEEAMGDKNKRKQATEESCSLKLRKSIATRCFIPAGTLLTMEHLVVKGPGSGISPIFIYKLLGEKVINDVEEDTLLHPDDLEESVVNNLNTSIASLLLTPNDSLAQNILKTFNLEGGAITESSPLPKATSARV